MEIGDIIKDRITHQYGIIVAKYKNNNFDWEVFALKSLFIHGHVWQDCRKEKDLSLRSYKEYAKSLITDKVLKEMIKELSFMQKLKLLIRNLK